MQSHMTKGIRTPLKTTVICDCVMHADIMNTQAAQRSAASSAVYMRTMHASWLPDRGYLAPRAQTNSDQSSIFQSVSRGGKEMFQSDSYINDVAVQSSKRMKLDVVELQ